MILVSSDTLLQESETMERSCRVAVVWLAAGLAAGCAQAGSEPDASSGGRADAAGGIADARPGFPDAGPGTPDAKPGIPDAAPTPDAPVISPVDAAPGGPDASCTDVVMQLLANADFDSGAVSWVESGAGYPIILATTDATYPLPVTPHSGTYGAWMGGLDSATRSIYQDVAIPANTRDLSLSGQRWIATEEITTTTQYDQWTVSLRNTGNTVLQAGPTFSNLDAVSNWTVWNMQITGDYSGQTVRVYMTNTNDISNNTNFFVDSVALRATVCQ